MIKQGDKFKCVCAPSVFKKDNFVGQIWEVNDVDYGTYRVELGLGMRTKVCLFVASDERELHHYIDNGVEKIKWHFLTAKDGMQ